MSYKCLEVTGDWDYHDFVAWWDGENSDIVESEDYGHELEIDNEGS